MPSENKRSFYALEMHVGPGGCRRGDCFVLSDLEAVKQLVTADLSTGIGVYLAAWYGEDILVTAYAPGEPPRTVDLLPFIRIRIPGYPDITFPDGECSFDFQEDEAAQESEEDALSHKLFCDEIQPSEVIIDWGAAELPPLPPPVLPAGEPARVFSHYLGYEREAVYGHNDFEGGDHRGAGYLEALL